MKSNQNQTLFLLINNGALVHENFSHSKKLHNFALFGKHWSIKVNPKIFRFHSQQIKSECSFSYKTSKIDTTQHKGNKDKWIQL